MTTKEAQSEAPSVDALIDWLLHEPAYTPADMRAKINRLIIEAELRGFDKAFDSHDYDGLREYRVALSNNLSKELQD